MIMGSRGLGAALAIGASLAFAATASAQLTKDEFSCQSKSSAALGKFTASKVNCINKCVKLARKGSPIGDCMPPYGGTTATCIADPLKGVEAKAAAALVKSCAKDCPECGMYAPCNAANAATQVAGIEAQVDALVPTVLCGEPNADKEQAKCTDGLGKNSAKYTGARSKILGKCQAGVFKGSIPPANCTPAGGNVADIKTNDALTKIEGKLVATLDKICFGPSPAEFPPCLPGTLDTSGEWLALLTSIVDGLNPAAYCGSPSGAFVE